MFYTNDKEALYSYILKIFIRQNTLFSRKRERREDTPCSVGLLVIGGTGRHKFVECFIVSSVSVLSLLPHREMME